MKKLLHITLLTVLVHQLFAQPEEQMFVHPRGIIGKEHLATIYQRINKKPFSCMLANIEHEEKTLEAKQNTSANTNRLSHLALMQSYLSILLQSNHYAEKAYQNALLVLNDTLVVQNMFSFGLSRADALKNISICYDLCFHAWNESQRKIVLDGLLKLMKSVAATMGFYGNYAIESNWMGVRYGSLMLSSLVWDDYDVIHGAEPRNRAIAFLWESINRLKEQITANHFAGGWNTESLGYYVYNWSFVSPALISLQYNHNYTPSLHLKNYAPDALSSLHAYSSSVVAIPHKYGKGIKPDFADDNPMGSLSVFATAFPLFPAYQIAALKWMHDYLYDSSKPGNAEHLFYSIAYYPEDIAAVNPEELGWLNFVDDEQGVVIFRNRFADENDIVAAFTSTQKRINGHQGPDNLSFRIIGLGSMWAIGGGRTGTVEGQTNLFPDKDLSLIRQQGQTGTMHEYKFFRDGSGFIHASGSCLDVENHHRVFLVDYSPKTGAKAVFFIADKSDNGKIWRMNTPEFNKVEILSDGFLLTAPNGASMKAVALHTDHPIIRTGKNRYGGNTIELNPGICYHDSCYEYSNYIDIRCDKNSLIVLSLQEKGVAHPKVSYIKEERLIMVGEKGVLVKEF